MGGMSAKRASPIVRPASFAICANIAARHPVPHKRTPPRYPNPRSRSLACERWNLSCSRAFHTACTARSPDHFMFAPTRDPARMFLFDTWAKYRRCEALAGLEQTTLDVILLHPEYHAM